jgi:hypothetical protein
MTPRLNVLGTRRVAGLRLRYWRRRQGERIVSESPRVREIGGKRYARLRGAKKAAGLSGCCPNLAADSALRYKN